MTQLDTNSLPAMSVLNLSKNFASVQALKGVSFEVKKGEVFGLLGPNGAGKTTLISIATTLEKPSSGRIEVFGQEMKPNAKQAKRMLGVVPQEVINHGFFDAVEILRFHAGYYGVAHPEARIDQLLKDLDLWDHRHKKVRQLSGGMRRRLMIAKGLVHAPGLLLLDEPTAGVDVELRLKLWKYIAELKSRGLSILLTTHYLEEAERLCDRVAIIHHGELRALDETRKLVAQWSRKRVELRVGGEPAIHHPDLVSGGNGQLVFLVPMQKTLGELLSEIKLPLHQVLDVKVAEGSLEEVFVRFTKGAEPHAG